MTVAAGATGGCVGVGGAESIAASTADMRHAATALDASGDEAQALAIRLCQIAAGLPVESAVAPISAGRVLLDASRLGLRLGQLLLELEAVSRGVRVSASLYDEAERLNRAALQLTLLARAPLDFGTMLGGAGLSAGGSFASGQSPVEAFVASVNRSVIDHPELVDEAVLTARLLAWTLDPSALQFETQVAHLLADARTLGVLRDDRPLSVTQAPAIAVEGSPHDLGDLVRAAGAVEHDGADIDQHTRVRVQHLVQPDGSASWIVTVPGTNNWSVNAPHNPSDATANVAAMAGVSATLYPAIASATRAAMKRAGVRPGSEPTMLVGHSQGGMVATRLAADPAFRTEFNVREVVAIASPTSRMHLPPSVHSLEVEHRGDLVPSLDGRRGVNAINRAEISCAPPMTDKVLDLHEPDLYAATADSNLTRGDPRIPQLRDFYDRTTQFFGGESTTYDYVLRRP